jgi:ABC-type uncharacterized transport system auxiliary subunit
MNNPRPRTAFTRWCLAGIGAALLSACVSQPPVPEDRYYRLSPPAVPVAETSLPGQWIVKRFQTDVAHGERAMLYADAARPQELRQYHYHYWTDIPPRLLQEQLIMALRASGGMGMVSDETGGAEAYIVNGRLRSFERLVGKGAPRAIIALELVVEQGGRTLLANEYQAEVSADDGEMHSTAAAFSHGLNRIYSQFITDLQAQTTR